LFIVKRLHYTRAVPSFCEADLQAIKHLVKPGDWVLDIGANVGWYTYALSSLVGSTGRVYSIEPIPETFALLSAVIKKLRLQNVVPMNYGISDADCRATMELPVWDFGTPNFYQARIIDDEAVQDLSLRQYELPMRSIDSLFLDLPTAIAFIKCDVEGHELSVIKGARHFFGKCRPAWFVEVSGDPDQNGSRSKELFDLFKGYDYAAYLFDGGKLRQRSPDDKAANYFFLQPSHFASFGSD